MDMVTSCGVLVKHKGKYILGHATGQKHFDIFKGRMEEGETHLQTALRECKEESGLVFFESDVLSLGLHDYIRDKMLYLYITKVDDIDINALSCTTYFDNNILEMDYYEAFEFDEMLTKIGRNLGRILHSLRTTIETF